MYKLNFPFRAVVKNTSKSEMQANLSNGKYIDYKSRKGGERYEVITPQIVKEFGHKQVCVIIKSLFIFVVAIFLTSF